MEVIKYKENPSCSSATGSDNFSKQCLVEKSFPADLQIKDVWSVGTPAEIPETQSVSLDMLSDDLKADGNSEDKLHIADSKMSILSTVTSNIQKVGSPHIENVMFMSLPARKFTCDICERGFSFKSHLSYHLATHSDYRMYSCVICGKGFKSNSYRINHQRTHLKDNLDSNMKKKCKDKSIVCTICGLTFPKRNNFMLHLLSHADKFSCIVCKKEFSRKLSLDLHYNDHLSKKQLYCSLCRRPWKSVVAFKRHLARHSNAAPFSSNVK